MTDHVMTARLMATTQTSAGMGAADNGIEVARRARVSTDAPRGDNGGVPGCPSTASVVPTRASQRAEVDQRMAVAGRCGQCAHGASTRVRT
jgi:hypothetical protein